jgi:YD repeat-containing protein
MARVPAGLGATATVAYNWLGQLVQATNPNPHATRFEYDAEDRITKQIDPLGNATAFTDDAIGNIVNSTVGRRDRRTHGRRCRMRSPQARFLLSGARGSGYGKRPYSGASSGCRIQTAALPCTALPCKAMTRPIIVPR